MSVDQMMMTPKIRAVLPFAVALMLSPVAVLAPVPVLAQGAPLAGQVDPLPNQTVPDQTLPNQTLRSPDAFADIADPTERSVALFTEMGKVIEHPRCLNCHPVTGGPTQNDTMHAHVPPVVRGEADMGAVGMSCNTCHSGDNVPFPSGEGSIPGHEPWSLAPVSMGWQGVSLGAICTQLKDPERNGNRTLEETYEHMAEDGLVGWAWDPGQGRSPAPGSQQELGALTRAWIDTGAACPAEG